jgi:ABC-type bacteriocin/lantibiotic exporter with double-glycine peptidase domain
MRAWCRAALTLILISCAPVPAVNSDRAFIIEGVPFFPQETYQCGPSSLAAVLSYWGVETDPDRIAHEIYSRPARGTLTIDMVRYARQSGLEVTQYSGGWEDLRATVGAGYPLIVLVDLGFSFYQAPHFVVVIGFSDDRVIVNSGTKERLATRQEEFLRTWQKTQFWTLRVRPFQSP